MDFSSTLIEDMTPDQLTTYVAMRTSDYLYQQSLFDEYRKLAGHARNILSLVEGEQPLPLDVVAMLESVSAIAGDQTKEISTWLVKEGLVIERLMERLLGA